MAELKEKAGLATEIVADGAEVIAEQMIQVAEVSRSLTTRHLAIGTGAVAMGIAIGGYVGYRFAEKRLSTKFEALMDEETEKLRKHYAQKLAAKKDKPDLQDLAQFRGQQDTHRGMVGDLGYTPQGEPLEFVTATPSAILQVATDNDNARVEVEAETVNIFTSRDNAVEWDYAREIKARDPRIPYVIHIKEWEENPQEFDQKNLTFYEGDEVLADEKDQVVGDIDEAVGLSNLERFGHGSGDPNTVFVRNEVREIDYEIALSNGMYAQEVHGFDSDQIQHSHESRRVRSRFDDD